MADVLTREELVALRARVVSIDRAVRALIEVSPHADEIVRILKKDLEEIDVAFETMHLILPEKPGDREALRDAVKLDLEASLKRFEQ